MKRIINNGEFTIIWWILFYATFLNSASAAISIDVYLLKYDIPTGQENYPIEEHAYLNWEEIPRKII